MSAGFGGRNGWPAPNGKHQRCDGLKTCDWPAHYFDIIYTHTYYDVLPKCQRLGLGGRPGRPTRSCFLLKLAPKGRTVAMSGTGNHDASDSDLSHLTSGWPGAPGVRGVPLTGNADGTSDSKYAQAQAATMAGPNAPLSSPLFSPLFPSFPPPFPFFSLCYSKIRTHRYREIANFSFDPPRQSLSHDFCFKV